MAFEVPALPYPYDALEPHIDEETMRLHHDKHHQTYVDKSNAALEGTELADRPVGEVLQNLGKLSAEKRTVVRNNAGGHYNHSLFWELMTPAAEGASAPGGELAKALSRDFEGFESFQSRFSDAAVGQFGSGWAWLIRGPEALEILTTPNQDSPIMDGVEPLLGLDVWEHAYYLKYQNRRPDYIAGWWNVVNWPAVEERYARLAG